jgi:hypothetical protein
MGFQSDPGIYDTNPIWAGEPIEKTNPTAGGLVPSKEMPMVSRATPEFTIRTQSGLESRFEKTNPTAG